MTESQIYFRLWKISEHAQKPPDAVNDRNIPPVYDWRFLTELRDHLYVIAHTGHIKEIMRRLKHKGEILSFSAKLIHNNTEYNWVSGENFPPTKSYRFAKQWLVMYKTANWILYHIS